MEIPRMPDGTKPQINRHTPGVCDNVSQSPSLQELHDDPEFISHQVAVVHLHHVVMVIVPHDHHLKSTGTSVTKETVGDYMAHDITHYTTAKICMSRTLHAGQIFQTLAKLCNSHYKKLWITQLIAYKSIILYSLNIKNLKDLHLNCILFKSIQALKPHLIE